MSTYIAFTDNDLKQLAAPSTPLHTLIRVCAAATAANPESRPQLYANFTTTIERLVLNLWNFPPATGTSNVSFSPSVPAIADNGTILLGKLCSHLNLHFIPDRHNALVALISHIKAATPGFSEPFNPRANEHDHWAYFARLLVYRKLNP